MRLQLALIGLLVGGAAHADDDRRASAGIGVYADDDGMLVVSPSAGVQVPITETVTTEIGFTADTVTGASVDVVTSASPHAIHEQREQLSVGGVVHLPRDVRVTARTVGSHEHDYDVVHGWLLVAAELADRNTVVELGYDHGHAWVASVTDPAFHATRLDDRAVLRVSQVADRRTYLDLLIDVSRTAGYQASPYRTVTIEDPASPSVMRVPEATPHDRRAIAAALRVRRAIGERWFAHAGYRIVADSWGVTSHTADALAIATFDGKRTRAGLRVRGYLQSSADFFRARYDLTTTGIPDLRTRDRTLGTTRSFAAELVGDRALGAGDLRIELALGTTWFWWPDDPLERERAALTSTMGIATTW